jgi:hypothetical protein
MKLPNTVYHLAEESNWPSIQRDGLLSTSKLLDAAGLAWADRARLERAQRLAHTELPTGVQIRDQRPMPPAALGACLVGLTPAEWYALINARVFFWFDPDRLNRQRAACEPRPQVVLAVDTAKLVDAYREEVAVTPINTGNARRKPARRGTATFVPYAAWVESGWESEALALGVSMRNDPASRWRLRWPALSLTSCAPWSACTDCHTPSSSRRQAPNDKGCIAA